jgi:hypothetical protein
MGQSRNLHYAVFMQTTGCQEAQLLTHCFIDPLADLP